MRGIIIPLCQKAVHLMMTQTSQILLQSPSVLNTVYADVFRVILDRQPRDIWLDELGTNI